MNTASKKWVSIWLFIGVFMVFIQIIIGGITRLTGSGLSITKWEIVTGTVPPLNEDSWQHEFDLYRATPQYQKINKGMSIDEFKFIYFWEYFHRLWARLMGFVFAIPFVFFLLKKYFEPWLKKRLIIIFLLACLVASFGWIMVASGLIDRPWVNAYKLTLHLGLALILYAYLLWTALLSFFQPKPIATEKSILKLGRILLLVLAVQLFLGGLMSGMKAGLFYPTWPKMGDAWIPQVITDFSEWKLENLTLYDSNVFAVAQVQFLHRFFAYLLAGLVFVYYFRIKNLDLPLIKHLLPITVLAQVIIGIVTVVNCKINIPVFWGVLHQGMAIILLSVLLSVVFFAERKSVQA